MKRIIAIFFVLLLFSMASMGQSANNMNAIIKGPSRVPFEDLRRPFILKLSPFHFFDNTLHLGGEIFLHKTFKNSIYLGLNGTYVDNHSKVDQGGALEIQYRHYPRSFRADSSSFIRNGGNGFYVGMGATFGINKYQAKDYYFSNGTGTYTINSQWITPHVIFGYQLIAWEALYFDVYLGGGIKINDVSYTIPNGSSTDLENDIIAQASIFDRFYKGILPKAGFTLGVGF